MTDNSAILVVDDDPVFLTLAKSILVAAGQQVEAVATPAAALQEFTRRPPAVLITDLQMPGMDGIELFRRGRSQWPLLRGVLVSAHVDQPTLLRIAESGFHACLPKPLDDLKRLARVVRDELAAARHWRRQLREVAARGGRPATVA